jgi:hypothetical protein
MAYQRLWYAGPHSPLKGFVTLPHVEEKLTPQWMDVAGL